MAKDNLVMWGVLALLAFAVFNNQGAAPATTPTTGGSVDLCKVVDPSASFTGKRMFLEGTAVADGYAVRVIKNGGEMKDLGQISLDSGTLGTAPSEHYKLYWAENSTDYYTVAEDYTAPCKEAVDNKIGTLCVMDTTPTLTIFDEYGNIQDGTSNNQTLDTSDEKDVTVRVRVSADQCYGNPSATGTNAICFAYNSSVYQSIKVSDKSTIGAPYTISNVKPAGYSQVCYGFEALKDTQQVDIPVTLKVLSGINPVPGIGQYVNVSIEDFDLDLNADDLSEIIGFEDEANNDLGVGAIGTTLIYVS